MFYPLFPKLFNRLSFLTALEKVGQGIYRLKLIRKNGNSTFDHNLTNKDHKDLIFSLLFFLTANTVLIKKYCMFVMIIPFLSILNGEFFICDTALSVQNIACYLFEIKHYLFKI